MHPEVGDMADGEFIFSTLDGKRFAYCNAFEPGAQVIHELMSNATPDCFQAALAHFADPLGGVSLIRRTRCSECGSTSKRKYAGPSGSAIELPLVQYTSILDLERDELSKRVAEFQANWSP